MSPAPPPFLRTTPRLIGPCTAIRRRADVTDTLAISISARNRPVRNINARHTPARHTPAHNMNVRQCSVSAGVVIHRPAIVAALIPILFFPTAIAALRVTPTLVVSVRRLAVQINLLRQCLPARIPAHSTAITVSCRAPVRNTVRPSARPIIQAQADV